MGGCLRRLLSLTSVALRANDIGNLLSFFVIAKKEEIKSRNVKPRRHPKICERGSDIIV